MGVTAEDLTAIHSTTRGQQLPSDPFMPGRGGGTHGATWGLTWGAVAHTKSGDAHGEWRQCKHERLVVTQS